MNDTKRIIMDAEYKNIYRIIHGIDISQTTNETAASFVKEVINKMRYAALKDFQGLEISMLKSFITFTYCNVLCNYLVDNEIPVTIHLYEKQAMLKLKLIWKSNEEVFELLFEHVNNSTNPKEEII